MKPAVRTGDMTSPSLPTSCDLSAPQTSCQVPWHHLGQRNRQAGTLTSPAHGAAGWAAAESRPESWGPSQSRQADCLWPEPGPSEQKYQSLSHLVDWEWHRGCTQGPCYATYVFCTNPWVLTRGNEQEGCQASLIVKTTVNLFQLHNLWGTESCVMTLILRFVPSQESHDKIMTHISAGMWETGQQRIKVGSGLGKFSKYPRLCELCWFYLLEALSSPSVPSLPSSQCQCPSACLHRLCWPQEPSAHLRAQLVVLSSIFTSFRGIYAKRKVDGDTVLINNHRWLSSAKRKEI